MEKLNTSMDASATSWLSDLEMEDYDLFPQCNLNLLDDEEFLSHDIASAPQGENLQQLLSSESYTSYPTRISETLGNSATDETSSERPTKQLKTNSSSWYSSSGITEHFSPKLSPSSSPSSQILSFENSKPSPAIIANTTQFYGFDINLNPKQNEILSLSLSRLGNMHIPAQTPKGSSENQNFETKTLQRTKTKRSHTHARDHIMAERKRREKLTQSFIALAALVPGRKKTDKASVLGDAIKYVKELQERLRLVEEQSKKRAAESVVIVNKPQLCCDDDSSSRDESLDAASASEALPHVKARVSETEVLLRILCQKQKGLLVKILAEIQNLHLFVVNSSVLPFGDSIHDMTIIAQMGAGYNLTIKDLVRNIRVAALKFLCLSN